MYSRISRFTNYIVTLAKKAVVGTPRPAVDTHSGRYADWVIVAIHGLREYRNQSYRGVIDLLKEMPRITRQLGLRRTELPDFSTLCLRKQLFKMPVWRDFLRVSTTLRELGKIQAIDASGMDRIGASQHYATKTNYTFKAVNTTLLVDCETGTILDIHCSMKQPHDSQVGWQVVARNIDKLDTLTADKGYDWELLRRKLQSEGITPVIKYREFDWRGTAQNALIDDETYHQRSNVESTFFALRQRYGSRLRARTWFGQFRELVLRCAVRNVELAVKRSGPMISGG